MAKIISKKQIMGAAQGALWAGIGAYVTDRGTEYLNTSMVSISTFTQKGPYHAAAVAAATGLLATGGIAAVMGKKSSKGAKKAGAYMAAGALLTALYPLVKQKLEEMTKPGGRRRRHTLTQALPSASAAPSTSMLRAGGGIVMGAPAVDVDAAAYSTGRPGGRYINPRFQWSNVREL
jgi:hypothetical protein